MDINKKDNELIEDKIYNEGFTDRIAMPKWISIK